MFNYKVKHTTQDGLRITRCLEAKNAEEAAKLFAELEHKFLFQNGDEVELEVSSRRGKSHTYKVKCEYKEWVICAAT